MAAAGVTDVLLQGLHLVKCLASTQGSKIRVNAILPGLLVTEWVRLHGQSCVLGADFKTERQIPTGEASAGKGQSLLEERSKFGNI